MNNEPITVEITDIFPEENDLESKLFNYGFQENFVELKNEINIKKIIFLIIYL